jgi:hypothetical protein
MREQRVFARQDAEKPFLPRLPKKVQMFLDPAGLGTVSLPNGKAVSPIRVGWVPGAQGTCPEDWRPILKMGPG